MNIDEIKQQIRDNIKFKSINPPQTGGQSCGIIYSKQRLYSEELDLTIETGYHKSTFKNNELLLELFESALNNLIT